MDADRQIDLTSGILSILYLDSVLGESCGTSGPSLRTCFVIIDSKHIKLHKTCKYFVNETNNI